jgi:UDPglucose 6-dehydrogenase
MRIAVYGLWHLGCVTAACLAEAGNEVVGLDVDEALVGELQQGRPPLFEPGLEELIKSGIAAGGLTFTAQPIEALRNAEVVWVTFDTPVNDRDEADVAFVQRRLDAIADFIHPGTLVLVSSQVPVGFTRTLQRNWQDGSLHYAYSPENLRLGRALDCFRKPDRVIVGHDNQANKPKIAALFAPFCARIEWMSIESAEMTKHALNAFLATSVTFINELARLCEVVGANAKDVERGLKSEGRIGSRAYLSPGAAFAGGTLARDVCYLIEQGVRNQVDTPLFTGVLLGNERHKAWVREHAQKLTQDNPRPIVAVLGLTYKPGTSTLRRSAAIELCRWLHSQGMAVRGHDPAVSTLPHELESFLTLTASPSEALDHADLAIVATEWPEYRELKAPDVCARMRRPNVIDPNHFLAGVLGQDPRITYIATGKAAA